jgi:hypothetical protein
MRYKDTHRKKVTNGSKSNRYSQKKYAKFCASNPISKAGKALFSSNLLKGLTPYL